MIFQGLGVNNDVVNVSSSELRRVLENIVHVLLECRSGIAQSEWHYLVGKSDVLCPERSAFNAFWKYRIW